MTAKAKKFDPKKPIFLGNLRNLDQRVYDCAPYPEYKIFRDKYNQLKPWGSMDESPFNAIPLMLKAVEILSPAQRRELVAKYFMGFPNGRALGDYINRVLEIKWLQPRTEFSESGLVKQANRLMRQFGNSEEGITIFRDANELMTEFYMGSRTHLDHRYNHFFAEFQYRSYYNPKDLGFAISKGSIIGPGLERKPEEPDMIMWTTKIPAIEDHKLFIKWHAKEYARKGALYTSSPLTQKDRKYLGLSSAHPYDELLNFCELGLLPYGISEGKGLLVWHPPVKK